MEVPVSADASKGPSSPRGGLQRQSSGSTGSARARGIERRSVDSSGAPPQERVSLTLQRISVQAPGAQGSGLRVSTRRGLGRQRLRLSLTLLLSASACRPPVRGQA